MAKKAKRRGRPLGSKNKPKLGSGKSVGKMELGQLRSYIESLHALLAKKIAEQRAKYEAQLVELSGYGSVPGGGRRRSYRGTTGPGTRAKAKPKYQSKKDPKLKWSGRGMTPVWMRDEMKGTKLTKDSFLIK